MLGRWLRWMTNYLHTMYRITDPDRSRAFYEALGLEFRREFPIVRDGQLEATNYFFGVAATAPSARSSRARTYSPQTRRSAPLISRASASASSISRRAWVSSPSA
jgi:catechol 2,3-dioxygenase-like lactoylglutathione lyase family enzyme